MMKRILICSNTDYNGASCYRCLTKHNFLEDNPFANESDTCDNCQKELVFEEIVVKEPIDIKKIVVIGGILVVALAISSYFGFSKTEIEPQTGKTIAVPDTSTTQKPAVKEPIVAPPNTLPKLGRVAGSSTDKKTDKTVLGPTINKGILNGLHTKIFTNGDKYKGEWKNNQMHGLGTYYYSESKLISTRDLDKRIAQSGDYIQGLFECGEAVNVKWFDKKGNFNGAVIIGGTGCTP